MKSLYELLVQIVYTYQLPQPNLSKGMTAKTTVYVGIIKPLLSKMTKNN